MIVKTQNDLESHVLGFHLIPSLETCLIAVRMGNHSALGRMNKSSSLKILQTHTQAHTNSYTRALLSVSYPALTQLSDLAETAKGGNALLQTKQCLI